MCKILFVGFRGKNNASGILAEQLSPEPLLLTNSGPGLKKDIDSAAGEYDYAVMFGVEKALTSTVRIEKAAVLEGRKAMTALDPEKIAESLEAAGITPVISDEPVPCLCNEAYWHALAKYSGKAVFIHIPTIKHADACFIRKMKSAFLKQFSGNACKFRSI